MRKAIKAALLLKILPHGRGKEKMFSTDFSTLASASFDRAWTLKMHQIHRFWRVFPASLHSGEHTMF
jgi:hypothetical protein